MTKRNGDDSRKNESQQPNGRPNPDRWKTKFRQRNQNADRTDLMANAKHEMCTMAEVHRDNANTAETNGGNATWPHLEEAMQPNRDQ